MCYGYDDNMLNNVKVKSKGVIFCRNSWGSSWGNKGNFKAAYGADGMMSGPQNPFGFIVNGVGPPLGAANAVTSTVTVKKSSTAKAPASATAKVKA